MPAYNEILQKYVDMSYGELLSIARSSLEHLIPALTRFFDGYPGGDPSTEICVILLFHCLGADGTLTQKECRFANDLLGADYSCDALMSRVQRYRTEDSERALHTLIDELDPAAAADFVAVGLCILAVDETINREEAALFRRLMD
jgi:uncharacterized tellurite resistance protein B-like protein